MSIWVDSLPKKYKLIYDTIYSSLERILPNIHVSQQNSDGTVDIYPDHGITHCGRVLDYIYHLTYNGVGLSDFSDEERFCLALSVVIHDYAMLRNRNNHAAIASIDFRNEILELKKSELASFSGFRGGHIEAISAIVSAHSDGRGNKFCSALIDIAPKKEQATGEIRVGYLASLLRLADELDCTFERLEHLRNIDMSSISELSKIHHLKCKLISHVKCMPNGQIELHINHKEYNEAEDHANLNHILMEVEDKISRTLDCVNEYVFHVDPPCPWWRWHKVSFSKDSQKLMACSKAASSNSTNMETFGDPVQYTMPATVPSPRKFRGIHIPDVRFEDELSDYVLGNKALPIHSPSALRISPSNYSALLLDGHFNHYEDQHVRSWINTSPIVSNDYLLMRIASLFREEMNNRCDVSPESHVLVGIGFPGLVLASYLSFFSGLGMTYVPSSRGERACSLYDKFLPDFDDKKIILITDMISTGRCITDAVQHLSSNSSFDNVPISAVYTVFFRPFVLKHSKDEADILFPDEQYVKIMVALNCKFDMHPCSNNPNKCIFKQNNLVDIYNDEI